MENYKLYWIKETAMSDPYTEGYIGITKRAVDRRLSEHLDRNDHIEEHHEIEVLYKGTKHDISALEKRYRPTSNIGWNKSPGGLTGGRPMGIHTSGWTQSEESIEKRRIASLGEGNGMFGKECSDKQKAAVAAAASRTHKGKKKNYKVVNPVMIGADNPRSRPVIAEGVTYDSLSSCAKAYGYKNHNTIAYRLKSKSDKWKEWNYGA